MAKLKKSRSSKKLSFSDVGLEPRPIFEIDSLSYRERSKKTNRGISELDESKDLDGAKKPVTKSDLKRMERKRKSLMKKSEYEKQSIKPEQKMSSNEVGSSLRNILRDREGVKSNSFISLEDSFKSISEFNNSSFNSDSNDGSSYREEGYLDEVEKGDAIDKSEPSLENLIVEKDTYENLLDEIMEEKAKIKQEINQTDKEPEAENKLELDRVDEKVTFQETHIEQSNSIKEEPIDVAALKKMNSLDNLELSAEKEEKNEKIVKSETPSPKKFSKRKLLYSFANSVWDYVKPTSLDELERKQSETRKNEEKREETETLPHTEELTGASSEKRDEITVPIISNLLEAQLGSDSVQISTKSKSQEVFSLPADDNSNGNLDKLNIKLSVSNSHSGSLISTPTRKSKREMIYNFANSIWDYVKPAGSEEPRSSQEPSKVKVLSWNDEVSDSEFFINDNHVSETEKEQEIGKVRFVEEDQQFEEERKAEGPLPEIEQEPEECQLVKEYQQTEEEQRPKEPFPDTEQQVEGQLEKEKPLPMEGEQTVKEKNGEERENEKVGIENEEGLHLGSAISRAAESGGHYLEGLLRNIAQESEYLMNEISGVMHSGLIGGGGSDKLHHEIKLPDLSELDSIQRELVGDLGVVNFKETALNKSAENLLIPVERREFPNSKQDQEYDQNMIEKMQDEILNLNLDIEEYDQLFERLHSPEYPKEEYSMNNLMCQPQIGDQDQALNLYSHFSQVSPSSVRSRGHQSASHFSQSETVLNPVSNCTSNCNSNPLALNIPLIPELISESGNQSRCHAQQKSKTVCKRNKSMNRLNKLNKKMARFKGKMEGLLNEMKQEQDKFMEIRAPPITQKKISKLVVEVEIVSTVERNRDLRHQRLNSSKTVGIYILEGNIKTQDTKDASTHTHSDGCRAVRLENKATNTEEIVVVGDSKKSDPGFKDEAFRVLDNSKLVRKGEKLKLGYGNDSELYRSNTPPATLAHFKQREKRFTKPRDIKYEIVVQSPKFNNNTSIRNYPESGSDELATKMNYYAQTSSGNAQSRNYYVEYGNQSYGNNKRNNYYSVSKNAISNSSFPNNVVPSVSRMAIGNNNRYHINYYCGNPGEIEQVKKFAYIDGLSGANVGSYYYSGSARIQ
ncbi:hypothetical protein HWI79_460 [Cryptosporidium felis]|nr:hypothetical protein HWI79_460 [Cryptosporidium felis]